MTPSHYPAETIAILLFGSSARGDADAASDRDVCVFVDTTAFTRFVEIRNELGDAIGQDPDSLSIYLAETAIRMARRGSLFIHHLSQEAKLLYDRDNFVLELFRELREFDGYAHELAREFTSEVQSRLW